MQKDEEILEAVLAEFKELAKIPRKSGHEAKVSQYLFNYMKSLGLEVKQDEKLNIIADKPAALGCEDMPLAVLQGHMDMVCVAADGVEFDPLNDPIKLRRDEKFLYAEGTTLGSDDGMGIAEILYILKQDFAHGPLRAIITVDEEQGMSGAIELSADHLAQARYLINCDSENYDVVTVSSAGSLNVDFVRQLQWQAPQQAAAYVISIKGLMGGHSGEAINCGRANAIRTLGLILRRLVDTGLAYEVATFSGGVARNAIPAKAEAVIVAGRDALSKIEAVLAQAQADFQHIYGGVEQTPAFVVTTADMPQRVFSAADSSGLLQLICLLHTGVYAMSQSADGLVETSANLGLAEINENQLVLSYFPRSAIDARINEFRYMSLAAGAAAGFDVVFGAQSPGWAENPHSRLLQLMTGVFEEQNARPMKVEVIHAGLECGWFFKKNPQLDMVSIGVTSIGIHTPEEKLELDTVAPQVKLMMEVLTRLKNS